MLVFRLSGGSNCSFRCEDLKLLKSAVRYSINVSMDYCGNTSPFEAMSVGQRWACAGQAASAEHHLRMTASAIMLPRRLRADLLLLITSFTKIVDHCGVSLLVYVQAIGGQVRPRAASRLHRRARDAQRG